MAKVYRYIVPVVLPLLLATAAAVAAQVADVPYTEWTAARYTDSRTRPVPVWAPLPCDGAVLSIAAAGAVGAYVLCAGAPDVWYIPFATAPLNNGTGAGFDLPGAVVALTLPRSAGADMTGAHLHSDTGGALRAVSTRTSISGVACTSLPACNVTGSVAYDVGGCNSSAAAAGDAARVWFASDAGLVVYDTSAGTATVVLGGAPMLAVAYHAGWKQIVAANTARVNYIDASTRAVVRWEWVSLALDPSRPTDISGGPFDDVVYALAVDAAGVVYAGTPTTLNTQHANRSVFRVDCNVGLPFASVTAVAADDAASGRVWIGHAGGGATLWDTSAGTFKYFYGPRYMPGNSVTGIVSVGNNTVLATDGGLAVITAESWTLARKAELYESILLPRHNREGLAASCDFDAFGDLNTCTRHDDDNSGLWTSLTVAAEAFRYLVTGDPAALETTRVFFRGMQNLNWVTGIDGLMARTYVMANESHGAGGCWRNSTTLPGLVWKCDTSSDEVTGHIFAYTVLWQLLPEVDVGRNASVLIDNIVGYIVKNGFYLIDVTGKPTSWGKWAPEVLNGDRSWSDGRGVNSLQILSWVISAYGMNGDPKYMDAYDLLTNATNQYDLNLLNLKITTPEDDNFSDDELTFLPYFTYAISTDVPSLLAPMRASLDRTWHAALQHERADLWTAMYLAITGGTPDAAALDGMVWNLRTWQLEMIDWPASNSQRADIRFDPFTDRSGDVHEDSVGVLPENERAQDRWNGNPHELNGGSGMSEDDPSDWLLPYWLARYYGLIVSA